MRNLPIHF